jgi:hypothetical protein
MKVCQVGPGWRVEPSAPAARPACGTISRQSPQELPSVGPPRSLPSGPEWAGYPGMMPARASRIDRAGRRRSCVGLSSRLLGRIALLPAHRHDGCLNVRRRWPSQRWLSPESPTNRAGLPTRRWTRRESCRPTPLCFVPRGRGESEPLSGRIRAGADTVPARAAFEPRLPIEQRQDDGIPGRVTTTAWIPRIELRECAGRLGRHGPCRRGTDRPTRPRLR